MTDTPKPSDGSEFTPLVGLAQRNWAKITGAIVFVGGWIVTAAVAYNTLSAENAALKKEIELIREQSDKNDRKCDGMMRRLREMERAPKREE